GIRVEVPNEPRDRARGERVSLEEDLRINRIGDLDEATPVADAHRQWVAALARDFLRSVQETPGQRQRSEVQKRLDRSGAASAAGRAHEQLRDALRRRRRKVRSG